MNRRTWHLAGLLAKTAARIATWVVPTLGAIWAFGISTTAHAVTYANAASTFSWIDASTHTQIGYNTAPYKFNGTLSGGTTCGTSPPRLDDTLSDNIPIGFTFMYGGVNFTEVRAMSNGRLQFNDNKTCGYGSPVTQLPYPNAGLNYTMRIYGNDLDPTLKSEVNGYNTTCTDRAVCYVSYATLGTAPYRSFVVTWNQVPEWTSTGSISGDYSVQIILQENGEFIYQYGANTPGAQAATAQVGWQVDTNDYDVPAVGLPTNNSAIKFYIARPVAEYRMEQPSWNGTANEVFDTSGNGRHGVRVGSAQTTAAGKVCRGGSIPSNTSTSIDAIDTGIDIPATVGGVGSISFWFKPNAWTGSGVQSNQLFDATTANNDWFFLTKRRIDNSNVRLRFSVRDSGGTTRTVETGNLTSAVLSASWVHIAVTWNFNALAAVNSDHLRIYVNGVLSATSAFTTAGTVSTDIGTLYVGDNRSANIEANGTARSANGTIDEFRIYNYEGGLALVQRDMNQTGACLDHYAITPSGTPTVCAPVQVTVRAHDSGHGLVTMPNNTTQISLYVSSSSTPSTTPAALSNGGDWSLVSGYGTFDNGTADDGLATYLFNGEYQAVLNYQPTASGDVYVHVTDGQIVESENAVLPVAACAVPSGFNCVETGQTGGTGRLYTKLAGTSFGFDVFALKSDGSTTETGYTGPVKIELVAGGATCGTATSYKIVSASQTMTSGKYAVPSSGTGSAAVDNAYTNVRCRVTDIGDTSLKSCSTDNFAIRPGAVSFATAPAMAAPPSATAASTVVAGVAFTLTAATATGATDGYGGSLTQDAGKLTAQITSQDTTQQNGGVVGTLSPSSLTANATPTDNASYSEVGYLYLAPGAFRDDAYTAVDQPSGCAATGTCDCVSDTTGDANLAVAFVSGKIGCSVGNTAAAAFGRFIPDHFDTAITAPTCGFNYSGQPMTTTVTAMNGAAAPAQTQNYNGSFAKAVTLADANALVTGSLTGTAVASTAFASGQAPAAPTYTFTVVNTAPGTIKLRASDADVTAAGVTEASRQIRSGRLRLSNKFGSEKQLLLMPVQAQYWSGNTWVLNSDDTCTGAALLPGIVTLANYTAPASVDPKLASGNLGAGHISGFTAAAGGGKWNLTLTAPDLVDGKSPTGSVDVTATVPIWLKLNGANPTARATFGLYSQPEHRRTVHSREQY